MRLHQRIQEMLDRTATRMDDAIVSTVDPLTVKIGPSTVAVPAKTLLPVAAGDKVQVLRQGAGAPLVLGVAAAAGLGGWVDLDSGNLDTTYGTITVPGGYRRYRLTLTGILDGGNNQIFVRPNGDTTSSRLGVLQMWDAAGNWTRTDWSGFSTSRVAFWGFNASWCQIVLDSDSGDGESTFWALHADAHGTHTTADDLVVSKAGGRVQFGSAQEITSIDVGRISGTIKAGWTLEGYRS